MVEKVFVTTEDGRLLVYQMVSKQTLSRNPSSLTRKMFCGWSEKKSLQLSTLSGSCMAIAQNKGELWVGCSNQIVIVNINTLLVETKLDIPAQTDGTKNPPPSVLDIVYSQGRIWCQLSGSAEILEFDSEKHLLIHTFCCGKSFPLYSILTDVVPESPGIVLNTNTAGQISVEDCQKHFDTISITEEEFKEAEIDSLSIQKDQEVFCDSYVQLSEETIRKSIRKCGGDTSSVLHDMKKLKEEFLSEKTSATEWSSDENIYDNDPPPIVPPRCKLKPNGNNPKVITLPSLRYPARPDCNNTGSKDSKTSTFPNLNKLPAFMNITKSDSLLAKLFPKGDNSPPFIPPRSPKQTVGRSDSDIPPPEVPPRPNRLPVRERHSFSCQRDISVRSMAVVGDTLWVGRSSGDILIININSNTGHFQEREVTGILRPVHQKFAKPNTRNSQVLKLLHVGHLVVSMETESSMNYKTCSTRIIAWEDYGTTQIHNVNQYWEGIRRAGRKLFNDKNEDQGEL